MLDAPLPGKRRRGRQKTRWNDLCKQCIVQSVGFKDKDMLGRIIFITIPAPQMLGNARGEEEEEAYSLFHLTQSSYISHACVNEQLSFIGSASARFCADLPIYLTEYVHTFSLF